MRGKILILTGLAVGYVLGARAGRERYEQIKRFASKAWNDPRVQHQVDRVEDFAKDKAPEVAEFITEGAKKVVAQVSGGTSKAVVRKAAKSPAKTPVKARAKAPAKSGGTPTPSTTGRPSGATATTK